MRFARIASDVGVGDLTGAAAGGAVPPLEFALPPPCGSELH